MVLCYTYSYTIQLFYKLRLQIMIFLSFRIWKKVTRYVLMSICPHVHICIHLHMSICPWTWPYMDMWTFRHIWACGHNRTIVVVKVGDFVSLYVLSLYTFCHYTFCPFLPSVVICFVPVNLLSLWVMSLYTFCCNMFFFLYDSSWYILSLYTFFGHTLCPYTFCLFIRLVIVRFVSLYLLSLYIMSFQCFVVIRPVVICFVIICFFKEPPVWLSGEPSDLSGLEPDGLLWVVLRLLTSDYKNQPPPPDHLENHLSGLDQGDPPCAIWPLSAW